MAKVRSNQFSRKGVEKVTQTAANTLSFSQLDFQVGSLESVAMVIQQMQWHLADYVGNIAANTDAVSLALVSSSNIATLESDDASVLALHEIEGMGVNVEPQSSPVVMDFTGLSGGGLLVSMDRLYLAMDSTGFAAAASAIVWIYYTVVEVDEMTAISLLRNVLPSDL